LPGDGFPEKLKRIARIQNLSAVVMDGLYFFVTAEIFILMNIKASENT
jgi:hypothetical protein